MLDEITERRNLILETESALAPLGTSWMYGPEPEEFFDWLANPWELFPRCNCTQEDCPNDDGFIPRPVGCNCFVNHC